MKRHTYNTTKEVFHKLSHNNLFFYNESLDLTFIREFLFNNSKLGIATYLRPIQQSSLGTLIYLSWFWGLRNSREMRSCNSTARGRLLAPPIVRHQPSVIVCHRLGPGIRAIPKMVMLVPWWRRVHPTLHQSGTTQVMCSYSSSVRALLQKTVRSKDCI